MRRLEETSRRFSWARLAVVVTGSIVVFWIFRSYGTGMGVGVFGTFLILFIVLVKFHDRIEESLKQTRLLGLIKERHERRRALDWDALPEVHADIDSVQPGISAGRIGGQGTPGGAFGLDPVRYAFAVDLNLIGPRSLHQLLDTSASKGGSDTLVDWLTDPTPAFERVIERQRLVKQLVPLRLFRDHLTRATMLDGSDASRHWTDLELREWLQREEVVPRLRPWLIGLSVFAAVNVGLIVGHIAGFLPMIWPMTVLIYFAVYFTKYRAVKDLFDESLDVELMLQRFMPPLVYIENFRFEGGTEAADLVKAMRRARPSTELKSLRRIAAGATVTRSEILWLLLNVLMPWNMLFTVLMHRSKGALRTHLPEWLDVWYTLEAASSLASHADYHPLRVFPQLKPASEGDPSEADPSETGQSKTGLAAVDGHPTLEGRKLGHPLLKEDVKVRNDFSVDGLGEVVLVTGSNMSGKSTFLRTVGVNLRLAYAGGPVDAEALRTICFRVFTSINVVDSVQEGLSHFYAEVRRLKMLLDALNDDSRVPLLNLIDEIFRGTNNRERLIGSRAFIRALAGRRAVTLVSTHDLELTLLENDIQQLSNFHFREDISGDRMTFDYTLRPGPSPTTNALKIMQQAGLPVEPDADASLSRDRGVK